MSETKRLRLASGRPCIVCGHVRRHDHEAHAEYRRRSERARNLLDRQWPKLRGLEAVKKFYATEERPAPSPCFFWARVLPSGEVVHVKVTDPEEVRAYHELLG